MSFLSANRLSSRPTYAGTRRPVQRSYSAPSRSTLPTGRPATGQGGFLPMDRINVGEVLDKFGHGATGFVGAAAQAPARVLEAPFAAVNVGVRRATGFDIARTVAGTPIGGVFGFLGEVVNRVGNFVPALINSHDADILKRYQNKPDSFVIPDFGESTGGWPILGAFGIGSRQKTLGEFRAEMSRRGFDDDSLQELYRGQRSVYDFGDRMINESALVDLGGRLVLDPSNLLFTPGVGAKLAAKLGLSGVGRAMGSVRFSGLTRAGLRSARGAPDVNVAVRAAEAGSRTSQMGMSTMIRNVAAGGRDFRGLGGIARGIGAGARAYVRPSGWLSREGFLKRSAATYGGLAVAANLPDGFNDALKGYAQETLMDQPMSENSFFVLATAMSTPVTRVGREVLQDARMSWWQTVGTDFQSYFKKRTGSDWKSVVDGLGEDRAMQAAVLAAHSISRDTLHDSIKAAASERRATGSMSQLDTARVWNEAERENLVDQIQRGRITPRQIVDRLVDLWEKPEIFQGRNALVDNAPDLPLRRAWNTEEWLESTNRYLDITDIYAKARDIEGEVAPGYAFTYTKEDVALLEAELRNKGDNLPVQEVRRFLDRNEILMGMAERENLAKYYAMDEGTIPTSEVVELLERTRAHDTTPTAAEYYAEDRMYELDGLMRSSFDPNRSKVQQIRERLGAISNRVEPKQYYPRMLDKFDNNYLYHKTRPENLDSIRQGGLKVGTGGVSYWSASDNIQVDPGFGTVLIRTKPGNLKNRPLKGSSKITDRGGQIREDVPASELEYLGADDAWHSLGSASTTPKPGMEQWWDHYNRQLTTEIAANVRRGDTLGEADRVSLRNALYSELRETLGDGDQIVPGMQQRHDDLVAAMNTLDQKPKSEPLPDVLKRLDLEADSADLGIPGLNLPESAIGDAYRERVNRLNQEVRDISKNYQFKKSPELAFITRPGDTLPDWLIREHNVLGSILFDGRFNPIGWFSNFTRALFTPVEGSRMAADAEQAVYNELIGKGAKPEQISQWLQKMRDQAVSRNVVDPDRGIRLYGRINALLPSDVNSMALEVFGKDSPVMASVGTNNWFRVLDRASSRTLRSFQTKVRRGGKRGLLMRASEGFRSGAPSVPAVRSALGGTRIVTNTMYPIFRFMADIRWHALNRYEAAIYALSKEGVNWKHGNKIEMSPATRRAAGRFQDAEAVDALSQGQDSHLLMSDPAETGWYHQNRITAGKVSRSFDESRVDSVTEVLQDMWDTDPGLVQLRQHFPTADPRTLAQMLDDQLFNFDTKGVKKTIEEEYQALYRGELDNAQFDPAIVWESRQVIQRLAEVNQKVYDDLTSIFVGNPNRTNIERIANSYWLYWPISYQIKASKWLVGTLASRAFGRNTNLLGAWRYSEMKEYHLEQLENNPEYKEQFEGNRDLWQTAMMFFPITPEDMGVNLSRPTRMITSLLGITEPNQNMRDPISAIGYAASIGPVYTVELIKNVGRKWFPEPVEQGILFDQNPTTPQGSVTQLIGGVTTEQPVTGTGVGNIQLPGTSPGSLEENPYDTLTFSEGGERLTDAEYAALMEARAQWDSREGV